MDQIILLGEKNNFGIKVQLCPQPLGTAYCQIYVNNEGIGSFQDAIYLDSFYDALMRVKNLTDSVYIQKNKNSLHNKNLFNRLKKNKIGSRMLIGLPENFDDFDVRVFKYENEICFLWRLDDKPYFEYNIEPGKIFYTTVDFDYFEKVLLELSVIINSLPSRVESQDLGGQIGT